MRRPLSTTLFPYTTLFRSKRQGLRCYQGNEILEMGGYNPWRRNLRGGHYGCDQFDFQECLGPRIRVCFRKRVPIDRKSTRLNSSHPSISYAVFCLKKKN